MIEVFAFATPNNVKVPIALEEMGLPPFRSCLRPRGIHNG